MTRVVKPAKRPRRRKGWLSQMKAPSGRAARASKTPLWHWFVIVPVAALFIAGVGLFVYVSYFNPQLARGERKVRAEVAERVERVLPDGRLDTRNSYLLVRIDGADLRLRPVLPQWSSIAKGDILEVEVGRSTSDGSPVAYSYTRVGPAPPGGPGPAGSP